MKIDIFVPKENPLKNGFCIAKMPTKGVGVLLLSSEDYEGVKGLLFTYEEKINNVLNKKENG